MRKPFCNAVLVLMLASGATVARAQADDGGESALVDLAQAFVAAQNGFDQAALERLLAPDYLEISPVGDVDARAEVIAFYDAAAKAKAMAGPHAVAATLEDTRTRWLGDDAVLIAKESLRIEHPAHPGEAREITMRVQFHFHRADGTWRLQTVQYTSLRPKPPAPSQG